jgi:hypothetical protein
MLMVFRWNHEYRSELAMATSKTHCEAPVRNPESTMGNSEGMTHQGMITIFALADG